IQRLVLLPKPGKPPDDPSAFRPICLIDGAGKVLEQLIRTRLEKAIAAAGDLSELQFGFRKATSTVDAISKVLLKSYFRGRVLRYDSDGGARSAEPSCGVPQGSVLAPLLWNAMYDGVLRLPLPERTELVEFADDITVVTVDKDLSGAEALCNMSISRISSWLASVALQLAPQKTEAVLVSSRKKVEFATIHVCGASIKSSRAIKYL
ncbi:hypothetical protein KR054_008601, partial [Drosophila jambulina]